MMTEHLRPTVRAMAGYTPGEQLNDPDVIKLNTNENPYPPSPRVIDAIRAVLSTDQLRKYPQPLGDRFRRAAGDLLNVDPDAILIGNGSDDILTILTRAFVPEGGTIVSPTPSYVLYRSLAEIQGAKFATVPFSADWKLAEPFPKAHLTLLPNPNSPSGTTFTTAELERIVDAIAGPFVLDEAYADFAEANGLALATSRSNVIVTRTMSKFYALAGIRFGFAVAPPAVVRELVKVKDSYNCDALALAAATAAIQDHAYYGELRSRILATRDRMVCELTSLGFAVTPSQANFLWCRSDRPLKPIADALKAKKILVRFMSYAGHGEGLRISVGSDAEIDRLLVELRGIG
jgi:histidinol-phosphate aminotransferase